MVIEREEEAEIGVETKRDVVAESAVGKNSDVTAGHQRNTA